VVYAPAERADTLPLFQLFPYMYSVISASIILGVNSSLIKNFKNFTRFWRAKSHSRSLREYLPEHVKKVKYFAFLSKRPATINCFLFFNDDEVAILFTETKLMLIITTALFFGTAYMQIFKAAYGDG
jgi:hypothetical protein